MEKGQVIKFGTDGWRAIIDKDFNFDNVAKVAQAIASFVKSDERRELSVYKELRIEYQPAARGLVVGYDTRRHSPQFGETVARVLSANNIPVYLVNQANPTPVVAHAVRNRKTAGAVMITASHNPAEYNGIKFKAEYAGSALPEYTNMIEARVNDVLTGKETVKDKPAAEIETFDPRISYLKDIMHFIDWELLKEAEYKVIADPLYGAGRVILSDLLKNKGIRIEEIHGELDPSFGGLHPEPIGKHIQPLIETVKRRSADAGLALDGDADRIGAVDEKGNFVNPHQIFALLLRYLHKQLGWDGVVVKTFSTTRMIDILASKYGLKLYETPIGFKHVVRHILSEDVLIGGEESGGIGIKNHLPERDGILCGLLLLQIMATKNKKLSEVVEELQEEVGPHYFERFDFHFDDLEKQKEALERFKKTSPSEVAGEAVVNFSTLDGWKFFLEEGSWVLFRASGTEPVIRLYVEAPDPKRVKEIISYGKMLIEGDT